MKCLIVVSLLVAATVAHPNHYSSQASNQLCVGTANGQKVASTCNSFVTCSGGIVDSVTSCEQGKLFSKNTGACDVPENVDCVEYIGSPQGPAPNCQGRVGQMIRNPYDCSSYYMCEHNSAILLQCSAGLYFDSNLNQCNWRENVVCSIDQVPTDPGAPNCLGRDWMYFPNYSNCGTYYRCENNLAVMYSCPEALLFDRHSLTCNWAPSVQC